MRKTSNDDNSNVIKPHVIVRDPSAINKSIPKEPETNVVKRMNMGIVYPEKQKTPENENILAMAKSITFASKRPTGTPPGLALSPR
jgi:hypothetical protein